MEPTVDELKDTIYLLGIEEQLDHEISQAVLDKLDELGIVNLEVDLAPQLTQYGEAIFAAIEAGEDVPDLEPKPGDR